MILYVLVVLAVVLASHWCLPRHCISQPLTIEYLPVSSVVQYLVSERLQLLVDLRQTLSVVSCELKG